MTVREEIAGLQATITELRAALGLYLSLPLGGSASAIKAQRYALDSAHEAWVNSAPIGVKHLVLKKAKERDGSINTYGEAVRDYGRSIVSEAEQELA